MLKPCPHRQAQSDGQLTCAKIGGLDREVTAELCAACPAAGIGCAHLRFSLTKIAPSSILIRWGNGKQEMLEAEAPHVDLNRGACAEKVTPIYGPAACTACPLRVAWDTATPAPVRRGASRRQVPVSLPPLPDEIVRPNAGVAYTASTEVNRTLVEPSSILVFRRKTA